MTLRDIKNPIRMFIQQWSDQRLAEVYAFNADGKMDCSNPCACLLGVTLPEILHQDQVSGLHGLVAPHYRAAKTLPHAAEAERAYRGLGYFRSDYQSIPTAFERTYARVLRQRRLSAILRSELRRRDRLNKRPELEYALAEVKR